VWPRFPILLNASTSNATLNAFPIQSVAPDRLIKQHLEVGQQIQVTYDLKVPESVVSGVFPLKFQLIDPLVFFKQMKRKKADSKQAL
jgi:hypothetical protein